MFAVCKATEKVNSRSALRRLRGCQVIHGHLRIELQDPGEYCYLHYHFQLARLAIHLTYPCYIHDWTCIAKFGITELCSLFFVWLNNSTSMKVFYSSLSIWRLGNINFCFYTTVGHQFYKLTWVILPHSTGLCVSPNIAIHTVEMREGVDIGILGS